MMTQHTHKTYFKTPWSHAYIYIYVASLHTLKKAISRNRFSVELNIVVNIVVFIVVIAITTIATTIVIIVAIVVIIYYYY